MKSIKWADENIDYITQARATCDWSSLYDVLCRLYQKHLQLIEVYDELKAELEKTKCQMACDHIDDAHELIKERDALKAEIERLNAYTIVGYETMIAELKLIVIEILEQLDKRLKPYGGGQYRFETSDALERAREALEKK